MAEDKGLIVNIVLVGSNPMPCYVQAAYLMDESRQEAAQLPVPAFIFLPIQRTRRSIWRPPGKCLWINGD